MTRFFCNVQLLSLRSALTRLQLARRLVTESFLTRKKGHFARSKSASCPLFIDGLSQPLQFFLKTPFHSPFLPIVNSNISLTYGLRVNDLVYFNESSAALYCVAPHQRSFLAGCQRAGCPSARSAPSGVMLWSSALCIPCLGKKV